MLNTGLIHPEILGILARAGHHAKILIADANYPAATKKGPNAEIIYLNLAPGQLTVAQVLEAILKVHPVDEAIIMATRLIVMSPRPGRIIKSYNLDFNQKFFKNRDARRVKSLPEFIDTRQEVLDIIHSDEIRIDQG